MNTAVKIFITDDHAVFRNALACKLDTVDNFCVIGEASNGKELIQKISSVKPDVLLLDVDMPVMNGYEAFDILNAKFPFIKVIMLSRHFNFALTNHFIENGARAYLPKECDINVLIEAIGIVNNKGYYFKVLNTLPRDQKEFSFTKTELLLFKILAEGKSNKEAAYLLDRSLNTVDFHKKNIYAKTGVSNAAELTLLAVRLGVISVHGQMFL